MLKKWFDKVFDHKISLRERMFRLVTGISMIALVFILLMSRYSINLYVLAGSLIYMFVVLNVSIQKDCINTGATAIVVLLLLLFPVSFFTAGGAYGGAPEWFVLCFIYITIALEGRRKGVFFLICMAETVLCYYIAYYYPQFVVQNTAAEAHFDSVRCVILTGVLTSVLLLF